MHTIGLVDCQAHVQSVCMCLYKLTGSYSILQQVIKPTIKVTSELLTPIMCDVGMQA